MIEQFYNLPYSTPFAGSLCIYLEGVYPLRGPRMSSSPLSYPPRVISKVSDVIFGAFVRVIDELYKVGASAPITAVCVPGILQRFVSLWFLLDTQFPTQIHFIYCSTMRFYIPLGPLEQHPVDTNKSRPLGHFSISTIFPSSSAYYSFKECH